MFPLVLAWRVCPKFQYHNSLLTQSNMMIDQIRQ